jgi:hypothetical protein
MIIVAIYGGLGNQMFQYATAKAVAERLGVELKLDLSLVNDRTPSPGFTFRNFELNAFNINESIAHSCEVRKFVPNLWNAGNIQKKLYKIWRLLNNIFFYYEKNKFQYEERIEDIQDNTYVFGYFQTELYFMKNRLNLLNIFELKDELNIESKAIDTLIQSINSVSVHIRRGDYVDSIYHSLYDSSYYQKAIEMIKIKIENPVFYFFSDDILWVKSQFKNLDIKKVFVELDNAQNPAVDLILMSHCKHNICANSSYSWWAAWLNINPEKMVIAPKKWFKSGPFAYNTYDLIPTEWLQI